MYIRRDRSNLHFGKMQRRRPRRWLFLLLLVIGIMAVVVWQFDRIAGQVATLLGDPPTPTTAAPVLAQAAYLDYINGDLQASADGFAAAVAIQPADANMWYEYGHVLLLLGENETALAAADQIASLDPADARSPGLQTMALYQSDRLDEALAVGLVQMENGSTFSLTYAALAWVYADLGRWEQAVEVAEQAVTLDPNSVDAYRAYAYALSWVGAREQAAQALEAAIELQPTLDFLYFELALTYRALQQVTDAIYAYEAVLALNPNHTRALLRLCETYYGLREPARAQNYCEQALTIDPSYTPAWRAAGQVYYMQSDFQRAVDAYEQCIALGSDDIFCWYQRGLAYYYLDRCDLAVPVLQESLERTQSEQILGFVRQGLRLCDVDSADEAGPLEPTPETVDEDAGSG